VRSKWLDWTPGFVGFVGSPSRENPIIRATEERVIENPPEGEATKPTKLPLREIETHGTTKPSKPMLANFGNRMQAYPASPRPAALATRGDSQTLAMPPGVRLIEWNLKEPPVAIETHMIVRDPALFTRTTLGELVECLTNPKRKYGWPIQKMIEHLAQVGVIVALESSEAAKLAERRA
jgi:hypothetical protein